MKNFSKLTLVASFMVSSACMIVSLACSNLLEVKGPSSDVLSQSVSPGVENIIHNLTENTIYSFRVLVFNSVGVVSTNRGQVCELISFNYLIVTIIIFYTFYSHHRCTECNSHTSRDYDCFCSSV